MTRSGIFVARSGVSMLFQEDDLLVALGRSPVQVDKLLTTGSLGVDDDVTIRLSMNEALVFFEWLASANEHGVLDVLPAERRVLLDLESQLEPKLPMVFDTDYSEQVDKARYEIEHPSD